MRIPGKKLLFAAGLVGVVLVIGLVAAITQNIGLAIVGVLLIQSAVLFAIVDTRRRQGGMADRLTAHSAEFRRVERGFANVSERVITETRATEKVLYDRIARLRGQVNDRVRKSQAELDVRADSRLQDIEAMFQLFNRLQPRAAMSSSGRWALEPSGLLRLVDMIEHRPIRTIVELGSGTSTVLLSYALEKRGTGGRIVSLDHDPHVASITRSTLDEHGFAGGPAEVRDAPMTPGVLDGHSTPWYDPRSFEDVEGIDLLVVDGPPKASGDLARYPALPMLLSRLSPGAVIVVDDAARPDETAMVERWLADVPGLRHLGEGGRQVLLVLDA